MENATRKSGSRSKVGQSFYKSQSSDRVNSEFQFREKSRDSISQQMFERVKSGLEKAQHTTMKPNLNTELMNRYLNDSTKKPERKGSKLDGKRQTYNLLEDGMLRIKHQRITSLASERNAYKHEQAGSDRPGQISHQR